MLLTPEKELLIIDALKTKFEGVSGVSNVIVENPVIDSMNDVVEILSVENSDGETEVKYIYISLLGFSDSEEDGCEDDPLLTLNYNAHIFWQFNEKRNDDSTSEKDFKALVLNLRNKFLEKNRKLSGIEMSETTPLKQQNFIILGNDALTGVYGHIVDLQTNVEIGY